MDFKMGDVLNLLGKTLPFLVFRFLIYMGIAVAYVVVVGVGAAIGAVVGHIGDNPAAGSMWGGLVGFGAASVALHLLREYVLYLVKAGHIAVLVELLDGRDLPEGRGQIDYAQKLVRERFAQSSLLFGVDQLIKGILRVFNRMFLTVTGILPIPGLRGLVRFVNTVVNLSLTYLDEVILAHCFRTRAENPWEASRTALVLYAQSYKSFLTNAFLLTFVIWGMTFLVFLIVLAPAAAVVSLIPDAAGLLTVVMALVFAWGVKQAVIEPIAMVALMQVFFKVTEGQIANPEWDAKLASVSGKFGELKTKAREWKPTQLPGPPVPGGESPGPAPA
jgi:hypothetical protein